MTDRTNAEIKRMSEIEPEEIEWLWPGFIALGKISMIMGDPSLGKSLVTLDMAARVTKGLSWPVDNTDPPMGEVLLLSNEDDPADTVHFVFCIAGLIFLLILAFKMDINKFLMSAASAFFGAGAAFLFNGYSNKKDEKRRNMAALIRTRYIINKIALIRTQLKSHIDKYKNLANDDFFEWEKNTRI